MNNKIFYLIFPLTVLLSCEKTTSKKYESTKDSSMDILSAKSQTDLDDSLIDRGKMKMEKLMFGKLRKRLKNGITEVKPIQSHHFHV